MANFLFWNLYKKPLQEIISVICDEHDIDVIILSEIAFPISDFLDVINSGRDRIFLCPPQQSKYLKFFFRYPTYYFQAYADVDRATFFKLTPPVGLDILIIAVHMPSKLFKNQDEQLALSIRMAETIREKELDVGHSRTIVVGDLNMNPFDPGMINADGFHGVMEKRIANKGSRKADDRERKFFYNPMWSLLGDSSKGPPGTYYHSSSALDEIFWHSIDQVLVRPELLDYFPVDQLKVLSEVREMNLLTESGIHDKENGSDHLPLLFTLHLEKEDKHGT